MVIVAMSEVLVLVSAYVFSERLNSRQRARRLVCRSLYHSAQDAHHIPILAQDIYMINCEDINDFYNTEAA